MKVFSPKQKEILIEMISITDDMKYLCLLLEQRIQFVDQLTIENKTKEIKQIFLELKQELDILSVYSDLIF